MLIIFVNPNHWRQAAAAENHPRRRHLGSHWRTNALTQAAATDNTNNLLLPFYPHYFSDIFSSLYSLFGVLCQKYISSGGPLSFP